MEHDAFVSLPDPADEQLAVAKPTRTAAANPNGRAKPAKNMKIPLDGHERE
ncbi:hypothetical protein MXD62_11015 [Frankia sp. Mgl5]|uniref:hypothetical protein n=1 Tax=Frankia sp. Mgl5 TaxID=2933793 RepID=UPI00200C3F16|nr:hypothetical protein [Frankia sp. Mgl5]MCK9927694.1 hypothetical protein [Frankia sp. Mgl5]